MFSSSLARVLLIEEDSMQVIYLLDLERLVVLVAQEVLEALQVPQHCFLEYLGFQGYPVAPVDLGDQEGQVVLAQAFFSLWRKME